MFFSSTFLVFFLMSLWLQPSVTDSALQCSVRPVFKPPFLLVRYGQPASATCSVCGDIQDCNVNKFGLEKPVGTVHQNGTNVMWEVDSLTGWDTSILCFYNCINGFQDFIKLDITLYQPPESVSIRFDDDGPLLAGQSYTLECAIQKVAPVKNLKVTFYKDQNLLDQRNSTREGKKPVDEIFTFSFNASEEDDGAKYWCEALLDLKVQKGPPAVSSQSLFASVHHKPRIISALSPETITVIKGHPLELNCSAVGKPSPSYTWTRLPDTVSFSNTSIYSKESVSVGDNGLYTCTVHNSVGTVTVNFTVEVKESYDGNGAYWILLLVLPLIGIIIYTLYYRCYHTGHYTLTNPTCCRKHTAVPTSG